jgi:hypothetical protein
MAAEFGHSRGGFVEIGVDEVAPVLRVEPECERRRTDEVAEHDRDLATFGVWAQRSRGGEGPAGGRDGSEGGVDGEDSTNLRLAIAFIRCLRAPRGPIFSRSASVTSGNRGTIIKSGGDRVG